MVLHLLVWIILWLFSQQVQNKALLVIAMIFQYSLLQFEWLLTNSSASFIILLQFYDNASYTACCHSWCSQLELHLQTVHLARWSTWEYWMFCRLLKVLKINEWFICIGLYITITEFNVTVSGTKTIAVTFEGRNFKPK
jgi:hypothetical protein